MFECSASVALSVFSGFGGRLLQEFLTRPLKSILAAEPLMLSNNSAKAPDKFQQAWMDQRSRTCAEVKSSFSLIDYVRLFSLGQYPHLCWCVFFSFHHKEQPCKVLTDVTKWNRRSNTLWCIHFDSFSPMSVSGGTEINKTYSTVVKCN